MPRGSGGNKARSKGSLRRKVSRKTKRLKNVVPLKDFINPGKKLREIRRRDLSGG